MIRFLEREHSAGLSAAWGSFSLKLLKKSTDPASVVKLRKLLGAWNVRILDTGRADVKSWANKENVSPAATDDTARCSFSQRLQRTKTDRLWFRGSLLCLCRPIRAGTDFSKLTDDITAMIKTNTFSFAAQSSERDGNSFNYYQVRNAVRVKNFY